MANARSPRLTPQEVKAAIDQSHDIVLVDVRKSSVYTRGHIPGAICLPITEVEARINEPPAGKSLVFY